MKVQNAFRSTEGRNLICLCALSCCLFVANGACLLADEVTPPATLVVRGKIWTGDAKRPWAEAVAARDEEIVAVGTRDEIAPLVGAATQAIDAGDGMVVPGLIDSHIHLVDGGLNLKNVQLRDATTREEFVRRLKER